MRRFLLYIVLMFYASCFSAGGVSINLDLRTSSAMSAAYLTEWGTESLNREKIENILDHYTSAEVATAGIFSSKWLDRKAMTNVGLFDTRENYYYNRIYALVSSKIMPKILTVASLMIRHPEEALYWGPYLFKVCEQTKQLCMIFETVVTNGKLSFRDIAFLAINDNLKGLFDLARYGNVDWEAIWNKLVDFGSNISKEDILQDLENLKNAGIAIASAGGSVLDDMWVSGSKVGKIFQMKPREIIALYEEFSDMYKTFSNPLAIKELVMGKILSSDSLGLSRLFTFDGYNITRYMSDYLQEMQGRYYCQRWYIYRTKGFYEEVYEEIFDSQYSDVSVIQSRFNTKVHELNTNEEGVTYMIGKGEKYYYEAADESKMRGCASVSFEMECDDNTDMAEGTFSWKENGDQSNGLDENSKRFAMQSSVVATPETSAIDGDIASATSRFNDLNNQILALRAENEELYRAISSASVEEATQLRIQINRNLSKISTLRVDQELAQYEVEQLRAVKEQVLEDYKDELDGPYRIPNVIYELETGFGITWSDVGHWEGFTYIRHGNMANIKGELEFRADLTMVSPEKHNWLIGRYHRAILSVHWVLKANHSSSEVIDVMEIDNSLSDSEKAEQVNSRLRQLMSEHPGCRIEPTYAYSKVEDVEDEEAVHLLWVNDRLAIARDVDYRLSKIHAQLVLLEKFLRNRESILDMLKRTVGIYVLNDSGRKRLGSKSFRRWRRSATAAASGVSKEDVLSEMRSDENNE